MRLSLFLGFLIFLCFLSKNYAQTDSIQQMINQQVWYPFMESYANLDAKAFMSIHSDEVIRINRDGQQILIGEEYKDAMEKNAARNLSQQTQKSIEFSFLNAFRAGIRHLKRGIIKSFANVEKKTQLHFMVNFKLC